MSENRFPCGANDRGMQKLETVCIDTNRVLDSCRDRDCFEDVKVMLTSFGNDILEHTTNIRAKSAHIEWTQIGIDPIKFNRGFYSVNIKFFVRICLEACLCGGRTQDFEGIAVLDKRVILYGSESGVSIFKSSADGSDFCEAPEPCRSSPNVPIAIVDSVVS